MRGIGTRTAAAPAPRCCSGAGVAGKHCRNVGPALFCFFLLCFCFCLFLNLSLQLLLRLLAFGKFLLEFAAFLEFWQYELVAETPGQEETKYRDADCLDLGRQLNAEYFLTPCLFFLFVARNKLCCHCFFTSGFCGSSTPFS